EARVARVKVCDMGELVGDHRAAVAADLLIWPEHEVVDEELPATVEQVDEGGLSARSVELVFLLDSHHRLAASLSRKGVALPRHRLLLGEDPLVCPLPFLR